MTQSNTKDRGKATEKEVERFLQAQSNRFAAFNYERLPDARAAGGRFKAMVADFDLARPGLNAFLEAKETEHDYRLQAARVTQLPRLRKWALSGRDFAVVVFHSKIQKWRLVPQSFLGLEGTPTSWDLRSLPLFNSAEEALRSTGWFYE